MPWLVNVITYLRAFFPQQMAACIWRFKKIPWTFSRHLAFSLCATAQSPPLNAGTLTDSGKAKAKPDKKPAKKKVESDDDDSDDESEKVLTADCLSSALLLSRHEAVTGARKSPHTGQEKAEHHRTVSGGGCERTYSRTQPRNLQDVR